MCGITGFWLSNVDLEEQMRSTARAMAEQIIHRGPDDRDEWVDANAGIALGFRRLAILDLSVAGRQPMISSSGKYIIVYNGEVYNFLALRKELESKGHKFRGRSDTEIMLAAFEEWGAVDAVKRFVGMFALALWDRENRILYLVRDRLGIKPLYYGWINGSFIFGSELKAINTYPDFIPEVDRNALALFLRHGYIPGPWSIYRGIYKLPPGSLLTIRSPQEQEISPQVFWSGKEIAERGVENPFSGTEIDAREELERLLLDAVGIRMIADVPLGAFLSGGIDSSTVVALMQAQSNRPVKTFTIGFHEVEYDEARYAKRIADHLGTDHTELYVTSQEARDVIPKLPAIYSEPFADSSQIPTYLISKLARQEVVVSLSGDGGDELFGGYNRYFRGRSMWRRLNPLPLFVRRVSADIITSISPEGWNKVLTRIRPFVPRGMREPHPGDKLHKLADVIGTESADDFYWRLVSHWKSPERIVLDGREASTILTDRTYWAQLPDFTQRMMFLDLITYLPDDILTKVDRASMAVSLEARVPLLDHRVVEFAWRLPLSMKLRGGMGKWLLRQVLYKHVPKEWIERPKMGFAIPLDTWLRGPLREWAEELLGENRLRKEGFFDPAPIRNKWNEHLSGRRNWQYYLWDILMFQSWLEAQ